MIDGYSDISKLMSKVDENKKTKIISFDIIAHKNLTKLGIEHEKVESYIDTIEIPLNIGNRLIKLKISRNFAIKLKKIFESIIYGVFNLKFNLHDSNTESIILLEFNPALYDDLLKTLSKTHKNIILLNE